MRSEKIPYAIERYGNEAKRLYGVLDAQSRAHAGALSPGRDYSIADIAIFPWVRTYKAQGMPLDDFPHVKRWYDASDAAPGGASAASTVGQGTARRGLDDEARKALFGQTARCVKPRPGH